MKSLTVGLSHVGRCALPGCGSRNKRDQWFETLDDMIKNRS